MSPKRVGSPDVETPSAKKGKGRGGASASSPPPTPPPTPHTTPAATPPPATPAVTAPAAAAAAASSEAPRPLPDPDVTAPAAAAAAASAKAPRPLPDLPRTDSTTMVLPAWPVMEEVVPWVLENLPTLHFQPAGLPLDRAPHMHAPTAIAQGGTHVNAYQAPWSKDQCAAAVRRTGFYQAAANITWLSPSIEGLKVHTASPGWHEVVQVSEMFFGAGAVVHGGSPSRPRLLCPVILEAHVDDERALDAEHFAQSLELLGGHTIVLAWWLAMFKALRDSDAAWRALLWECGLSVTACVRCVACPTARNVAAIRYSEQIRTVGQLSDTFVSFAFRLRDATDLPFTVVGATKTCTDFELRFNGAPANRTMMQAAKAVVDFAAAQPEVTPELDHPPTRHIAIATCLSVGRAPPHRTTRPAQRAGTQPRQVHGRTTYVDVLPHVVCPAPRRRHRHQLDAAQVVALQFAGPFGSRVYSSEHAQHDSSRSWTVSWRWIGSSARMSCRVPTTSSCGSGRSRRRAGKRRGPPAKHHPSQA